jgi:histone arginine demethylase JMJD6
MLPPLNPVYLQWNALMLGTKRWVLLPPGIPRASCRPRIPGLTDGEAVTWFTHILPRCMSADWPHAGPIQAIQCARRAQWSSRGADATPTRSAGDPVTSCLFPAVRLAGGPCSNQTRPADKVVSGWWHAVLNTEHTVAVTQNYVSSSNFEAAWRHVRKARPKLSLKWLAALCQHMPDLAALADAIDSRGQPCLSESSPSSSSSTTSSESVGGAPAELPAIKRARGSPS